jgi:hypothetical protein
MGEKDLWLKIGLIVMLVALSVSFIYPPGDKLKPVGLCNTLTLTKSLGACSSQ